MRSWFITGASRGLGMLLVRAALERGDAVVVTARNPAEVVAALGDHPNLLAIALDVTHESQARAAVAAAIERFGRIDVLVNNAGFGLLGAVEEASAAEVERVFATNVFGLLNVTRAALPFMRAARGGHVINLSSIGGYRSSSGWGVYCATKFAVELTSPPPAWHDAAPDAACPRHAMHARARVWASPHFRTPRPTVCAMMHPATWPQSRGTLFQLEGMS